MFSSAFLPPLALKPETEKASGKWKIFPRDSWRGSFHFMTLVEKGSGKSINSITDFCEEVLMGFRLLKSESSSREEMATNAKSSQMDRQNKFDENRAKPSAFFLHSRVRRISPRVERNFICAEIRDEDKCWFYLMGTWGWVCDGTELRSKIKIYDFSRQLIFARLLIATCVDKRAKHFLVAHQVRSVHCQGLEENF